MNFLHIIESYSLSRVWNVTWIQASYWIPYITISDFEVHLHLVQTRPLLREVMVRLERHSLGPFTYSRLTHICRRGRWIIISQEDYCSFWCMIFGFHTCSLTHVVGTLSLPHVKNWLGHGMISVQSDQGYWHIRRFSDRAWGIATSFNVREEKRFWVGQSKWGGGGFNNQLRCKIICLMIHKQSVVVRKHQNEKGSGSLRHSVIMLKREWMILERARIKTSTMVLCPRFFFTNNSSHWPITNYTTVLLRPLNAIPHLNISSIPNL